MCKVTFALVCIAALSASALAQDIQPCEVDKLSGDATSISFGASVAISGDYIVVGDPFDDEITTAAGAVHIFQRGAGSHWGRKQKIFGSDTNFQDNFGYAVAMEGDRIVVGAPFNDPAGSDVGKAYVFHRVGDTWVQEQELVSSGSAAEDHFGSSVSIYGDIVGIGAPGQGNWFGRVYVFHWDGNGWTESATLIGLDTVMGDSFGTSVSLNQGRLLIGAMWDEAGTGAAYVFSQAGTTWTQEAKLTASDLTGGGFFGASVSLYGDEAVVGAYNADTLGPGSGAAYAYRRSGTTWANGQKLFAPDLHGSVEYFGNTVRINQDTLLIGASSDDDQFEGSGSVYVFERNGSSWTYHTEFYASESAPGEGFGQAIGSDGAYAAVSSNSGTYIYTLPQCIPTLRISGLYVFAGVLVIAGIALLRRGKLNITHNDDS